MNLFGVIMCNLFFGGILAAVQNFAPAFFPWAVGSLVAMLVLTKKD